MSISNYNPTVASLWLKCPIQNVRQGGSGVSPLLMNSGETTLPLYMHKAMLIIMRWIILVWRWCGEATTLFNNVPHPSSGSQYITTEN
jgi:hypothetical protein